MIDADGWSLVLILRVCKTGFRVHKGGDGDGVALICPRPMVTVAAEVRPLMTDGAGDGGAGFQQEP